MSISTVIMISVCLFIILVVYLDITTIKPYLKEKNEIKNKEIINEKNRLLATIDIEYCHRILDQYFSDYLDRYIMYRFISKKAIYIKSTEVDQMIKDLTKRIALDISELYVFYLTLEYSLTEDDSLVEVIFERLQELAIPKITEYNSPE